MYPKNNENPKGGVQGIFWGLRLYFTVYADLSHNTDNIDFNKIFFKDCLSCDSNIGRVDSPYCPGSLGYIFLYRPNSTGIIRAFISFLTMEYWKQTLQHKQSKNTKNLLNLIFSNSGTAVPIRACIQQVELPTGEGYIWPYILSRVLIRKQYIILKRGIYWTVFYFIIMHFT